MLIVFYNKLIIFLHENDLLESETRKSNFAAEFKPISVVVQNTKWTFAHVRKSFALSTDNVAARFEPYESHLIS